MTDADKLSLSVLHSKLTHHLVDVAASVGVETVATVQNKIPLIVEYTAILAHLLDGEWQQAMDAADKAGFVSASFPELIRTQIEIDEIMAKDSA